MRPEQRTDEEAVDLTLAAELQAALLPKECPSDCPHQLAAARNRMCGSVGGDFYDFIRINDEQFAILIGDVVGHGVRASLMMAQIMGFLRSRQPALSRPVETIRSLNEMLMELGERTSSVLPCSIFYAVIDTPTGVSIFVNCGHPRPLLLHEDDSQINPIGPRNLLLGVEKFDPVEGCHTFEPGQRLVLYTDGLTDAVNADGELFGRDRLEQLIRDYADSTPDQCADTVFQAIAEFRQGLSQNDDETIVVIDRI